MTRLFFVLIFIFTVNNPAWAANWNQGSSSDSGPKKTSTRVHSYGSVKGVDVSTYVASGKIIRDTSLKIWSPNKGTDKICLKSSYNPHKKSGFDKIVYGYQWPNLLGGASKFNSENLKILNFIVEFQASAEKNDSLKSKADIATKLLKKRLLNAAEEDAFTSLKWDKKIGSSPAFVTAVTVKANAFVIAGLESMDALSEKEFQKIDTWIQKLIKNMAKTKCSNGCDLSPDSMVSVFSANILYGAASKNRELFDLGQKELESYLKNRETSAIGYKVRNDNEVMHHAVIAAEVLQLNGIDAYEFQLKDGSFDDAVSYHAQNVLKLGLAKTKTMGDKRDEARSIMRKQGFGTHLAWIPVYLSRQNQSPAAIDVQKLHAAVRKVDPKPYFGLQVGLHTGCYFGGSIN